MKSWQKAQAATGSGNVSVTIVFPADKTIEVIGDDTQSDPGALTVPDGMSVNFFGRGGGETQEGTPMAVKRTPEQEEVVKNRGGALLVSAAAGSGKTRVLVERLMDYILQEGRNIDEFLIITFTRAAAEELRARIAKEIAEALAAQPDHAHLRQQTVRLYETQISTIHAFCTVLLRQWGHLLDIPGDFALCEDEEAQVLMTRTPEPGAGGTV